MEKIAQLRLEEVSLTAPLGLKYILKDISLQVFKGEQIGIIGASGAGKTSLLRILNRLSEATSGKIYLENQDYRKIPVIDLRCQIMLLLQESKLLGMTVKEALAYPLILQKLPAATIQEKVINCMEELHISEDWLHRTEVQLSVGQRQLVAIARALIVEPKILLLDEPTSALDEGRSAYILEVLTRISQKNEMTILMVNHQIDVVKKFCNRVLYLEDGNLVEDVEARLMDWDKLRSHLIQIEAKTAEEWD